MAQEAKRRMKWNRELRVGWVGDRKNNFFCLIKNKLQKNIPLINKGKYPFCVRMFYY